MERSSLDVWSASYIPGRLVEKLHGTVRRTAYDDFQDDLAIKYADGWRLASHAFYTTLDGLCVSAVYERPKR